MAKKKTNTKTWYAQIFFFRPNKKNITGADIQGICVRIHDQAEVVKNAKKEDVLDGVHYTLFPNTKPDEWSIYEKEFHISEFGEKYDFKVNIKEGSRLVVVPLEDCIRAIIKLVGVPTWDAI